MIARDEILRRVRANQPPASPLPAVPAFGRSLPATLEVFRASLERMGGRLVEAHADPGVVVRELFPEAKVIVSACAEVEGNRVLTRALTPGELGDVDVGIARARFGVSETGSVAFSESELRANSLAFLPQHFVVLLDPRDIVDNIHDAYRNPIFREAKYCVLVTGPSATADIEGVLIHGAQGVRSLSVIPWPREGA